ncbi:MAG: hypothetical protein PHS44_00105 [Candidatus Dojkabacteria bacterium]|jgi:hypothetical protein|nr:hypothetical protein [Candidatus Dojkabacteria bacterium]
MERVISYPCTVEADSWGDLSLLGKSAILPDLETTRSARFVLAEDALFYTSTNVPVILEAGTSVDFRGWVVRDQMLFGALLQAAGDAEVYRYDLPIHVTKRELDKSVFLSEQVRNPVFKVGSIMDLRIYETYRRVDIARGIQRRPTVTVRKGDKFLVDVGGGMQEVKHGGRNCEYVVEAYLEESFADGEFKVIRGVRLWHAQQDLLHVFEEPLFVYMPPDGGIITLDQGCFGPLAGSTVYELNQPISVRVARRQYAEGNLVTVQLTNTIPLYEHRHRDVKLPENNGLLYVFYSKPGSNDYVRVAHFYDPVSGNIFRFQYY